MIFIDYPGHLVAGLLVAVLATLTVFAFRMGEMRHANDLRRLTAITAVAASGAA